jgi:hypothetical protein
MCNLRCNESDSNRNNAISSSNKFDSTDFYRLFDLFNLDSSVNAYLENRSYSITDSVNIALKNYYNTQKSQILSDTNFQKAVLFFFEKNYVKSIQNNSIVKRRQLANFTLWGHNSSKFIWFLVAYANQKTFDFNDNYEDYCKLSKDISCLIDFENRYKHLTIINPMHKEIHLKCLKTLPDYCVDE